MRARMNTVQKIDISSSTILRIFLMIAAFWMLYLIRDVLVMLLASVIISFTIEPLANRLRAYTIPRGVSVVIVYLVFLGVLAGAVTLILPALAQQMSQLAVQIPEVVHDLEVKIGRIPGVDPASVVPQLQRALTAIGENLTNLGTTVIQRTRSVFSGLFSFLFVFVIAFYLVIEKDALKKLFRFIVPRQHMPYVEFILERIEKKLGQWVLGQVLLGVVVGVLVGVLLWAFGIKYALALGLIAGLLEVFPIIGPLISGGIGTILALSQSLTLGFVALAVYILVQQAENHFLTPKIMHRATGLNPLVTLLAVLLGGRLVGFVGVILAVPVAIIISILLSDFFSTGAEDHELAG